MKVLIVELGTTGKGGSFRSAVDLKEALENSGYDVYIALANPSSFISHHFSTEKTLILFDPLYTKHYFIKVINFLFFSLIKVLPALKIPLTRFFHLYTLTRIQSFCHVHSIQNIHSNNQPHRDFFLSFIKGVSLIMHIRSLNGEGFTQKEASILNDLVTQFCAVSPSAFNYWRDLGLDSEKIKIIPNFTEYALDKEGNLDTRFDILYIGRLVPEKGLDHLITAIPKLRDFKNDIMVGIVGDGDLLKPLLSKAESTGIKDNVRFLGHQENPIPYLLKSSLLIQPSMREGFGRTIIEAMSCKVPVVASNVEGIKDIITNKENGLLFEYGNINELIKAVISILNDKSLSESLTLNAFKDYQLNYTKDVFKVKIKQVYDSI